MPSCNNDVFQMVERGYTTRTIKMRCGQTSIHGDPLECQECRVKRQEANKPPPGYCRHGRFINTDHDIPCSTCEMEAS